MRRPRLKISTCGSSSRWIAARIAAADCRVGFDDRLLRRRSRCLCSRSASTSSRRHWRGEHRRSPAFRERDDGAVLGDHGVHESEVADEPPEVVENPARDDDDRDAVRAHVGDGAPDLGIQGAVCGDRAVVVESEDGESHAYTVWRPALNRPLLRRHREAIIDHDHAGRGPCGALGLGRSLSDRTVPVRITWPSRAST